MEKLQTGRIKKICVGDPKNGMHYRLDQTVMRNNPTEGVITSIQEDVVNFLHYGMKSYVIYVKPRDTSYPEFLWRRYEGQPVDVVYEAQKVEI